MEYTEKVAWLRRYRESLRQEQLLGEEIGQLESQARRVTRAISGMPGGGGDGQAIPRALERLEETRQKLAGLLEQDQAQRAEIEAAIQKEPIPLRRDILARRVTRAISGMPGGGGDGQAIPRAVERLEETRQKLAGLLEQDQAQRAEIAAAIQKEPIPLRRDILTRRYILGQRWEKIAAAHHLVLRQVFRLHHQAVDGLDL